MLSKLPHAYLSRFTRSPYSADHPVVCARGRANKRYFSRKRLCRLNVQRDIGTIDKSLCNERSLEKCRWRARGRARAREREMTLNIVGAHAPEIPPKPSASRSGGWVLRGFAILQAPMLPLSRSRQTQGRREGGREDESLGPRRQRGGGVEEGRISSVRGTSSRRRVPRTVRIQYTTRTHNRDAPKSVRVHDALGTRLVIARDLPACADSYADRDSRRADIRAENRSRTTACQIPRECCARSVSLSSPSAVRAPSARARAGAHCDVSLFHVYSDMRSLSFSLTFTRRSPFCTRTHTGALQSSIQPSYTCIRTFRFYPPPSSFVTPSLSSLSLLS